MVLPDKSAYRVRLVLEKTVAIDGAQWVELDSETFAVYDNSEQDPALFSTIDAAKAGRMRFEAEIRDQKRHTVRGGKGVE